jgi:hypothetical protein
VVTLGIASCVASKSPVVSSATAISDGVIYFGKCTVSNQTAESNLYPRGKEPTVDYHWQIHRKGVFIGTGMQPNPGKKFVLGIVACDDWTGNMHWREEMTCCAKGSMRSAATVIMAPQEAMMWRTLSIQSNVKDLHAPRLASSNFVR